MFRKKLMTTELKFLDKNQMGMIIEDKKIILKFFFRIKLINQTTSVVKSTSTKSKLRRW